MDYFKLPPLGFQPTNFLTHFRNFKLQLTFEIHLPQLGLVNRTIAAPNLPP